MRIRLYLSATGAHPVIPIDYRHALRACIYGIIDRANAEYAARLHDRGFSTAGNQRFKYFCFSDWSV